MPKSIILKLIFTFSFMSISVFSLQSQEDWKLNETKENIKIYTKKPDGSKYEQVRLTTTINASLSEITAMLEDVKGQEDWVYATKSAELIGAKNNESEFQYYMVVDMPFPAKNRDVVIQYKRSQNPDTKVVTTYSKSINGVKEKHNKLHRLEQFSSTYTLKPIGENLVAVEYFLQADPGGTLPAWMVNLFTTKGPYESMLKLVRISESGDYRSANNSVINF